MSERLLLIANLGAEEAQPAGSASEPAVRNAVQLWRALFAADAELAAGGPVDPTQPPVWPEGVGDPPEAAVFDWLGEPGQATAWLVDEAATRLAADAGRVCPGPAPEIVRRVHDKAFALATARETRLGDAELLGAIEVFEPGDLVDAERVAGRIDAALARWPDWLRAPARAPYATLKPRFGSSARGRVAIGGPDDPAIAGALPRLAAQGGALLEPWLERRADLSTVLRIDPQGSILLLGTLASVTTPAGGVRGHRGTFDTKARVTSDSVWDEALRESAFEVARAAAEAGYHGPCGVDAFVYTGPDGRECLRPVVEFNARFTLGHVTIGWIRRLRVWLKRELAMGPDQQPRRFRLDLAPAGGESGATSTAGLSLALGPGSGAPRLIVPEPDPVGEPGVQAGLESDR